MTVMVAESDARPARAPRWAPAAAAGLAALGVTCWTMAVSWAVWTPLWWQEIPPRSAGLVVIAAGVVAWVRLPSPRIGWLMVLGAAVYYLQYLRAADGVLFAIGFCLAYSWMGIAAHVLLAWPTGRLSSRFDQGFVIASHLIATGTQVVRYVVDHPEPPWAIGIHRPVTFWGATGSVLGVVMGVAAVAIVVRRWAVAAPVRRRPAGPVWIGIGATAAIKIAEAVVTVIPAPVQAKAVLASLFTVAVIVLIPLLYLVRWLVRKLAHQGVVDLLNDIERDLASISDPGALQAALRRSLGDPTLTIAYVLGDGRYVDIHGQPVTVTGHTPARSATVVRRRGDPIAVIEHDAALDGQAEATDAAITAVALAIDNARLYATQQAQLEQLRLSRLRLAQTAFDERRRIQRDLHDGSQQRFFRILMLLDSAHRALASGEEPEPEKARRAVSAAHAELTDTIRALRDLTQGIYPAVLNAHGLGAAIENLADRAPLPVTFQLTARRWPKHVEITAYFVISEALANVYKHSGATTAHVRAHPDDRHLVIEITDDGHGGARPGDGLTGLRHRVEGVGGELGIISEAGHGTTLRARLPEAPETGATS